MWPCFCETNTQIWVATLWAVLGLMRSADHGLGMPVLVLELCKAYACKNVLRQMPWSRLLVYCYGYYKGKFLHFFTSLLLFFTALIPVLCYLVPLKIMVQRTACQGEKQIVKGEPSHKRRTLMRYSCSTCCFLSPIIKIWSQWLEFKTAFLIAHANKADRIRKLHVLTGTWNFSG